MIVLGIQIKANRWPWQDGYNWRGMTGSRAPLNLPDKRGVAARFGGGWRYKLGVDVGSTTVLLNLVFGMVSFAPAQRCTCCGRWFDKSRHKSSVGWLDKSYPRHTDCHPPKK